VNRSDSINELAAALAKAQGEIGTASKDRENPHFRSRYATLASVQDACRSALSRHGLSVVQLPGGEGQRVEMTTVLMHSSGQWISCSGTFIATKSDPQGMGSAITYARRYQLAAIVGVAPDDDDDGKASEPTPARAAPPPKPTPKPGKLHGPLATWLVGFGWPAAERRDRAEFLLAHAGATFDDCCDSRIGGNVLAALQQRLAELTVGDMTEAEAREALFAEAMKRAADEAIKGGK